MILSLSGDINESKNKTSQSDYSVKLELNRTKQELLKTVHSWETEKLKAEELEEMLNINEEEKTRLRLEWQVRE